MHCVLWLRYIMCDTTRIQEKTSGFSSSFVLCNIKLSNLCNYYFFYLKLKIKSISPWARYRSPAPPPTTLQEWYHFVQGNETNQNRGVPKDLIGMHYAIWAIFKMAAFENDENNKRSIYDWY